MTDRQLVQQIKDKGYNCYHKGECQRCPLYRENNEVGCGNDLKQNATYQDHMLRI